MRGLWCYRGGCILSAAPLRLDNQFIFHSVSATNCLQNYNKNSKLTMKMKKTFHFPKKCNFALSN
jgi:hypothetical protein